MLNSRPFALVDCHCIDCRRSAGAPYVQWGSVPRQDLLVTKGEPRKIPHANRIRSFAACCDTHWLYDELLCAVWLGIDWQNHPFFAKRDLNHDRTN